MKKKLLPLVAAALLSMGITTVEAQIDSSELVLGGILLGEPMADVVADYGEPVTSRVGGFWYAYCSYGDTMGITVQPDDYTDLDDLTKSCVVAIGSKSRNGVRTPKGISVGSTEEEVLAAYGAPDTIRQGIWGKDYTYYDGENHRGASYLQVQMKDGVVISISVCENTGE